MLAGWLEGVDGWLDNAFHSDSSQDKVANGKCGLYSKLEGVCGYNHCNREVSCCQSMEGGENPWVPCDLYQRLFGFLDRELDLQNLSQV